MDMWISVKDKLPTEDDAGFNNTVLYYNPELELDEDFPGHPIVISNRVYIAKNYKRDGITHWMPLPKPPING